MSPDGRVVSQAEWDARHRDWLPTPEDEAYVGEPDEAGDRARASFAGWIAPPARGINGQPMEFEYVRLS